MSIHDKFTTTRQELAASLIERDTEIDLALTALVCKEHVLFVGPPGTAKSMLASAFTQWLAGRDFGLLVNKFTTPEEVFGPISVAGLKADKYRRVIVDKMPEADIAFIDEIFKASSAILNTMLQILNERTFRNDGALMACPLKLCIAASNEWPGDGDGGKELGALFDRFLFRRSVRPIGTEKGIDRLLWTGDLSVKLSTRLSTTELDTASAEAAAMKWDKDAKDAFLAIYRKCKAEGITPGDRRLRKSQSAVQAFAWVTGSPIVLTENLEILSHTMWEDPTEQPKKVAEIVGEIANPAGMKINGLLMEAEQIIAAVDRKDVSKTVAAIKKMGEIEKQLKAVTGLKAEQARDHVSTELRTLKEAMLAP